MWFLGLDLGLGRAQTLGRILNGDDWVWPIVLRQRGGMRPRRHLQDWQGNRSGESISPSQVAGTPQSPLRFHSLPRESALGGQRLVCMLGRDRERDHACRPRERNTRTCNTHSRAENTWGIGTMSCHSGREEYASQGITSLFSQRENPESGRVCPNFHGQGPSKLGQTRPDSDSRRRRGKQLITDRRPRGAAAPRFRVCTYCQGRSEGKQIRGYCCVAATGRSNFD